MTESRGRIKANSNSLTKSNMRTESSGDSDQESNMSREIIQDTSNRINCILTVDSNTILMGSHTGVIYVYDGSRNQKNKLPALPSSVLSMLHFQ